MKRPWMKFYLSDWRADPRLRICSLSARGLWIDLISYMHEGKPYGHLTIDGVIPSVENIASLVACPIAEVRKALAELETKQVCSRSEDGAIFSRRMVRDNEKAARDAANGKIGGNPKITKTVNRGVNPPVKGGDKAQKPDTRIDDADDAGARGQSMFTSEAKQLCDDLMRFQRLETDDPRCIGALYTTQAWLTKGWKSDVIREAVHVVMSRRSEAPNKLSYFEKPIAAAHAERARPLPVAEIIPMESAHVRQRTQAVSPLIAAADELVARARQRVADLSEESGVCDGEGAAPTRAIPSR